MKPPYNITNEILQQIASISEKLGEIKLARLSKPPTELRKQSQIRTIQSSLQIEGNTLTVEQITDLLNNKRVIAPPKDILEVKNAIKTYSLLHQFKANSLKSFCDAHKFLMAGLIDNAGSFRTTSVGIIHGSRITHVAPSGDMVYALMKNLFDYLKDDDAPLLLKSCVFHYEMEFIHPFTDGNGRMGRLWQTVILKNVAPVFEYLPIEILIKQRQQAYYDALGKSDKAGNSTAFIEFMLSVIDDSLENLLATQNINVDKNERMNIFRDIIGEKHFTRQDYLRHNKEISPATASRDLKNAVENGLLEKSGDKRLTKYRFIHQ